MRRRFECALVTGASSGIGRALVLELAQRGATVVALARRADRLADLASEFERRGSTIGRVHIAVADVTDTRELCAVIARLDTEQRGSASRGFDLVIANAGVGLSGNARALPFESIERTLAVNVLGAAATLHAALPGMLARRRGTLCGVSSLAGRGGMPGSGAYAASKAALSTLLETFAIDLCGSGVDVCDVQPGYVHSEMTRGANHPLPLVWTAERAARHIVNGLERGRTRICFPWPIAAALTGLALMPRGVWRRVFRTLGRAR